MKIGWTAAVVLGLLVALLPARAGEAHEDTLKQMLAALDKMAVALESAKDGESAKAAQPELRKAADGYLLARQKAAALPPPEQAEKDRLAKEYRPKMQMALKKFFSEVRRVETLPEARPILVEIRDVVTKKDEEK
jgi:hypothetical protein